MYRFKRQKSPVDPIQQNMGFEIRVVNRTWRYGYISTQKISPKNALLPKMPFQGIYVCVSFRQACTPRTFRSDLVDYNFKVPWSLRIQCHCPCPHWHVALTWFSDGWGLFRALRSVWFISTDEKMGYRNVFLQNKNPIPLGFWNSTLINPPRTAGTRSHRKLLISGCKSPGFAAGLSLLFCCVSKPDYDSEWIYRSGRT